MVDQPRPVGDADVQHQGWNFFTNFKGKLSFLNYSFMVHTGRVYGAVGMIQQAIVKHIGSISPLAPDVGFSMENGHHEQAKILLKSYLIKHYKPSTR